MRKHKRKLARHESEIATANRGIQTIRSAYSYAAPLRDFLARFVGFTVTEDTSESQDDILGDLLEYAIVAVENLEQTETASVKLRALAPEDQRDSAQFPSMTQVIFRVIHALSSTSGRWDRSNVLATGFTSRDEEGATIGNPVVQRYASDHYRLLCGVQWQRLLERIGGHAMMFLLRYGSIYVTIDKSVDSAFHQLSGIEPSLDLSTISLPRTCV
ncbi:hypothetical protein BZA70DRAFT_178923 [Myxozyma melibiosi]|uniref:Uncharacterized protein n=1 Tax=Myxozyma melibiosi TaxID=54550 RepID=A0ABR1F463_9ASCO